MRFLQPQFLWLLLLLVPLAFLYTRRGAAPAVLFSTTSIAKNLGGSRKASSGKTAFLLRLAGLVLLIIALARPQFGSSTIDIEASGIDILLAVDVSGSMEAMDFTLNGQPTSRLSVVKQVVNDFIKDRPNDRIGLLAFSQRPYLISPLTLDHNWLLKRLESLQIGMVNEKSTAIGSAIASGVNRLREQRAKSKIIILLTDGMSNSGRISPSIAAEAAEALGIKVYTIGAGTRGEAPMPDTDQFGRKRLILVPVDIDEKTLKKVAEMTGATYFRATNTASLQKIYNEINTMETTSRKIKRFENYKELFPYVLVLFFLTLGCELYYTTRRTP